MTHDASKQNAIDIGRARRAASINVADVRDFLNGGAVKWRIRERIVAILSNDPVFDKSGRVFQSRTEQFIRAHVISNRVYQLQQIHNWSPEDTDIALSVIDDGRLTTTPHNVAFEPVFRLQAAPQLFSKYAALIASKGIIGCYMQTELAHGSNVNRLETTATYMPKTREFEIHSPTLTSTKWWIGALGKTATHGIVQAKLILPSGKDMGPHLFFVQLRSLDHLFNGTLIVTITDTHKSLPGRLIGDIGPKALGGWASTDNGFARFHRVRIPKENMLSKFAGVTDEGEYVTPPHAKMGFSGLLYFRSKMVTHSGWLIAKGATASIRYTTVRRQGEVGPDGLERQTITYPSLYIRLVPLLARAFVFIELGRALVDRADALERRLSSGDTSQLAEMHVMTSGLKVLASTIGIQDLETARRSMGGHGYSAFAGVGKLYADFVPAATYEGENFVLDQQVVRAALKTFRALFPPSSSSTELLSPTSHYLRLLLDQTLPPTELSTTAFTQPASVILLLEWRAALLVQEMAAQEPDATGIPRTSRAITEAFVAARVGELMNTLGKILQPREAEVVRKLYLLYLLTTVESALVDLLSLRLFPAHCTSTLRRAIMTMCGELLPEAIGLSDAFGFSDWELDSALGVYDGKVYEAMWARVQAEPLNQSDVTEAYQGSIKPMLERGRRLAAKL